jgi:hypothetical protein
MKLAVFWHRLYGVRDLIAALKWKVAALMVLWGEMNEQTTAVTP